MATLLADSLEVLRGVTQSGKARVLKSDELSRTHRERLVDNGFLVPIINGWLAVSNPAAPDVVKAGWGSLYWEFCRAYLSDRYGTNWVLSPESSVPLLTENLSIPPQLVVRSPEGSNNVVKLPNGNSIYVHKANLPEATDLRSNLRVFTPEQALCQIQPNFWKTHKNDVLVLLWSIRNASSLLRPLLSQGKPQAAGRIVGALRIMQRDRDADAIKDAMTKAGHDVREHDPFDGSVPEFLSAPRSAPPVMARIRLMWSEMRGGVFETFEHEPRSIENAEAYLADIDNRYVSDAYNSLTIEGYAVSEELIEKVRNGDWQPEQSASDWETKNALAAKGYWLAFQEVRSDIEKILGGVPAAEIVRDRHQDWFRTMFQPSVAAGLVKPENLAGYRGHLVFLSGSNHVPVSNAALPDAMDAFFEVLVDEGDPRIQALLGPFIFTYIHPFPDGNGRTARFMMNTLLAGAGLPWTVIPVERRKEYMAALESASSNADIRPLSAFISDLVSIPPAPRPKETAYPKWKS